MKSANLALSFILEVFALFAYAYAAFVLGARLPWNVVFAVGLPISLAVIWSLFLAPRASYRIPMPGLFLVKLFIFIGSSAALFLTGSHNAAYILFGVIFVNMIFVVMWKQL